jgi:hypothetical protein
MTWQVIPVHYTLFTLSSMTGSIIMYQEYHVSSSGGCTQWYTLHFFLDGIFCNHPHLTRTPLPHTHASLTRTHAPPTHARLLSRIPSSQALSLASTSSQPSGSSSIRTTPTRSTRRCSPSRSIGRLAPMATRYGPCKRRLTRATR